MSPVMLKDDLDQMEGNRREKEKRKKKKTHDRRNVKLIIVCLVYTMSYTTQEELWVLIRGDPDFCVRGARTGRPSEGTGAGEE